MDELVLRHLLPLADAGLESWGVSTTVRDRYLGIIADRCRRQRNGSSWQVDAVAGFERRGLDRPAALTAMLKLYCEGMHANAPVHTWDIP